MIVCNATYRSLSTSPARLKAEEVAAAIGEILSADAATPFRAISATQTTRSTGAQDI